MAKKQILLNIDEELVDKLDAYRYANKMTRTAAIIKCIQDGIPDKGQKVISIRVGENVPNMDADFIYGLIEAHLFVPEPSETPDASHLKSEDGW